MLWPRRFGLMLFTLSLASSTLTAGRAHAQEKYELVIREALAEYDRGNWIEARALFQRAHALRPSARTLRGAGAAAYEAKSYVAAYQDFSASLAATERPLTAKQRGEVERFRERANAYLARITLTIQPDGAELRVDGDEPVFEGPDILLDPGTHELTLSAPAHETERTRIVVEAGTRRGLELSLRALEAAPVVANAGLPAPGPAVAPVQDEPTSAGSHWPWIAAGGAVVFAGAAIGLHLAAVDGVREVERACPLNRCADATLERRIEDADVETFQGLSIASWLLAGASAATAAVLFLTQESGERGETKASATLRLAASGATLSGRF